MKPIKTIIASAIYLVITILSLTSCESGVIGSGSSSEHSAVVNDFSSINIAIPAEINITNSPTNSFHISAQQNILDNMDIYIEHSTLYVKFHNEVDTHTPIVLNIEMPSIHQIDLSETASLNIWSSFESEENFRLSASSSTEVTLKDTIKCDNFYYEISNTSYFSGNTIVAKNKFIALNSGTYNTQIKHLECDEANIYVSGEGHADIAGNATTQNIELNGDVQYSGHLFEAERTTISGSGTGNISVNSAQLVTLDMSDHINVTNH